MYLSALDRRAGVGEFVNFRIQALFVIIQLSKYGTLHPFLSAKR